MLFLVKRVSLYPRRVQSPRVSRRAHMVLAACKLCWTINVYLFVSIYNNYIGHFQLVFASSVTSCSTTLIITILLYIVGGGRR